MPKEALLEQFFTSLIGGDRRGARAIVDEVIQAGCSAEQVLARLFWPTLEHVQDLYRHDQMTKLAHHFATRLMRSLVDQLQPRLAQAPRRGQKVLMICGPEEPEELAAQMAADLMDADGYDVYFAGGGVANDEIVNQLGEMKADVLAVFSATAGTLPYLRQLIDYLHEIGVCPHLQVAVGGGVFNRAEGLAEEIGADLWAATPEEFVAAVSNQPRHRADDAQRTVGRKRRSRQAA